jgi:predicted molibdopterin-dependent oxidoreductase YjgC
MNIHINGKEIVAKEGETIIEAARREGVEIPSLCYAKDAVHKSSCMICAVRDCRTGQIIPSCTTKVTEGMEIDAESEEVVLTRTLSLELLLSDHRADCEAPCRVACPGNFDIARMNRLYDAGRYDEALELLRDTLVIPATLCYICNAPCEKICRRGDLDGAVGIREIKKRLVARTDLQKITATKRNGLTAAVTGSDPAALAAAYHLSKQGYDVTVFEKSSAILVPYIAAGAVPEDTLALELEAIRRTGVRFACNAAEPLAADFDLSINLTTKSKQPARMVAEGAAAVAAKEARTFNSSYHRFTESERKTIAVQGAESGCLYCDCAKKTACRLRRFATDYNIKSVRYAKGNKFDALQRQAIGKDMWFEPAKCIRCGLCVYNSTNGFTFKDRGFIMQVVIPEENIANVEERLATLCPTGAIYGNACNE